MLKEGLLNVECLIQLAKLPLDGVCTRNRIHYKMTAFPHLCLSGPCDAMLRSNPKIVQLRSGVLHARSVSGFMTWARGGSVEANVSFYVQNL